VLDKSEYSAFESTLNSSILSYYSYRKVVADVSRVCGLTIIDVTGGVADEHEEYRLCTSKSLMLNTKSIWVILGQLDIQYVQQWWN